MGSSLIVQHKMELLRDTTACTHPSLKRKRACVSPPLFDEHPLAQTLRTGVFPFLSLRDAVLVLNCCKRFRNDPPLTCAALSGSSAVPAASKYGRHLFQECRDDWFDARFPLRMCANGGRASDFFGDCMDDVHFGFADPSNTTKPVDPFRDMVEDVTADCPWLLTQLLSLIAVFDKCILPVSNTQKLRVSSQRYHLVVIPMAISLWQYLPQERKQEHTLSRPGATTGAQQWTRDDVRVALNAFHDRLGDDFTFDDPEYAYVSQFGAHWDSIVSAGARGNGVTCGLCDLTTAVVADIELCKRNYRECDYYISKKRRQWMRQKLTVKQICEELSKMDAEFDEVKNVHDALAYLVSKAQIEFPPFPPGKGLPRDDLLDTLREEFGFPKQCRDVSQPLKQFLLKHCTFTNRILCDWIPKDAFISPTVYDRSHIELVAGVTPSGFLCGAYIVTYESE